MSKEINIKVKENEEIYTGGGITVWLGELEDGTFFIACDDNNDVTIVDADPRQTEDWAVMEWIEAHLVRYVEDDDQIKAIMDQLKEPELAQKVRAFNKACSMKTTVERKGKGHFEVQYADGCVGTAFYDVPLSQVIHAIESLTPYREPISISWVKDYEVRK